MAAEADFSYEVDSGDATRVRLRPFNEGRALWRDLLEELPGATLYHREPWIQLLERSYALPLWLATLHQDGKITSGCVFARAPLSRRFVSLPFSDTCPPVARAPKAALRLLDALTAQAPSRLAYEVRGIRGGASWETVEHFVNWRLDLEPPLAQIEDELGANFRRNLRRASQQGIRIDRGSSASLLERFYTMQLESRRRLGLPPQPWRFFELAREIFATQGNFEVWVARANGADVASAVFLHDGEVVHYKWGARRSGDSSSANHLLFWSAIEEFSQRARVLDLGRTDTRNPGLMRFKRELGARSTALPSTFYPRAPNQVSAETLTGTLAIAARIWRRLPIFATQLAGRVVYRYLA